MNMVEEYEKSQRRIEKIEGAIPLMKRMRDAMAELDTCSSRDFDYCLYRIKRLVLEANKYLGELGE